MSKKAARGPEEDMTSRVVAERANDTSDSSPDPPRRATQFTPLRSGSGKWLAQKKTEPDSPEGE